jgi:hypothetical protein
MCLSRYCASRRESSERQSGHRLVTARRIYTGFCRRRCGTSGFALHLLFAGQADLIKSWSAGLAIRAIADEAVSRASRAPSAASERSLISVCDLAPPSNRRMAPRSEQPTLARRQQRNRRRPIPAPKAGILLNIPAAHTTRSGRHLDVRAWAVSRSAIPPASTGSGSRLDWYSKDAYRPTTNIIWTPIWSKQTLRRSTRSQRC